jgi:hypothetical protein
MSNRIVMIEDLVRCSLPQEPHRGYVAENFAERAVPGDFYPVVVRGAVPVRPGVLLLSGLPAAAVPPGASAVVLAVPAGVISGFAQYVPLALLRLL